MILKQDYQTEVLLKMEKTPSNYVIIDTAHYKYDWDKTMLKPGLKMILLCNNLRMINDTLEKCNSEKIDFSILGEVMNSIYINTPFNNPFNNEKLDEFIIFSIELEKKARALMSIAPIMEQVFIPDEIIMHLMGFDLHSQAELDQTDVQRCYKIKESFEPLYQKVLDEKLSITEFKNKAFELLPMES